VVFTALPAFEAAHRTWAPVGVLLAGLAVTGLAGAYLINATRHHIREQLQARKAVIGGVPPSARAQPGRMPRCWSQLFRSPICVSKTSLS